MRPDINHFSLTAEEVNYLNAGRGAAIIARKTVDEKRGFSYASIDVIPPNSDKPHISIREITPFSEAAQADKGN